MRHEIEFGEYLYLGLMQLLLVAGLLGLRVGQGRATRAMWDVIAIAVPIIPMVGLLTEVSVAHRKNEGHSDVNWYVGVIAVVQFLASVVAVNADLGAVSGIFVIGMLIGALGLSYWWCEGNDAMKLQNTHDISILAVVSLLLAHYAAPSGVLVLPIVAGCACLIIVLGYGLGRYGRLIATPASAGSPPNT